MLFLFRKQGELSAYSRHAAHYINNCYFTKLYRNQLICDREVNAKTAQGKQ